MSYGTLTAPRNEAERLKTLLRYEILDTLPEAAYDEIARIAAQITGAPFAYIGFVDANRLWFKSRVGFTAKQWLRTATACQYVVLGNEPMLVHDAAIDSRFLAEGATLAPELDCRSYAGAPLCAPGGAVGTLAVLSPIPQAFTEEHASILAVLARQVVTQLEQTVQTRAQERAIRARQRIERALTAERNFVSAVLDTMPALVLVLDSAGRIVRFNRACEEITGYTSAELAGRPIPRGLFSREDHQRVLAMLCNGADGKQHEPRELSWFSREGQERCIAWNTTNLSDGIGETSFIIMTGVDVTERRRLDRMKDEFISTVSHELRTPLTSLNAAVGLLASGALRDAPDKSDQMMQVAIGNSQRLVRLVNDILDFERMGAGRLTMQFAEASTQELLHHAAELHRPQAEKARIGLRVEPHSLSVWIDRDRILQTLGNLISNAIKFSPQGSEVVLSARPLHGTHALLSVRDQGRGIPAEKLELIFERFQQVDASDSRAMGGAGLGLAICRNIIRQHGGRIWAESVVGQGSAFHFTIPLRTRRQRKLQLAPSH